MGKQNGGVPPERILFGYDAKLGLASQVRQEDLLVPVHYPCWDGCPHFRGLSQSVGYWEGLREIDGSKRVRPAGLCSTAFGEELVPYSVRSYILQLSRTNAIGCFYFTGKSTAGNAMNVCYPFSTLAQKTEDLCPAFALDELGGTQVCVFSDGEGSGLTACPLWKHHKDHLLRNDVAAQRLLAAYLGSIPDSDSPMLIPGVWLDEARKAWADFALIRVSNHACKRVAVFLTRKTTTPSATKTALGSKARAAGFEPVILYRSDISRNPAGWAQELLQSVGILPSVRQPLPVVW